ncbi:IGc2 [Nesidiocoris tenuis]|uniref:IGc2 n=1 Tax=Nesidiocoris tenuis TaxID=355587 RepID=A0ABN7AFZ1_9HEMI|nr:IGc2 [Nesidiocoris tenuis]
MKLLIIILLFYFETISGSDSCHELCICLDSYVDCSRHNLDTIPDNLPNWLEALDLSNNSFQRINSFGSLGSYAKLNKLKLDHNLLDQIPITSKLYNVTSLSLSNNKIRLLPSQFWDYLPNLQFLDLSFNVLTVLNSSTLLKHVPLQTLNLNNNLVRQIEGNFSMLRDLVDLKLSHNELAYLKKESFRTFTSLKKLDINKNKLTAIGGLTFKGSDKLKILRLRQNAISKLEDGAFWGLQNLQILRLDHNDVTTISKGWTYGLASLQELYLASNRIRTVEDDSWEECENLLQLDLSNNDMSSITPSTFKHLSQLQKLKLDGNTISGISEGAFNCTPSLKILELNHNHISWIVEDMSGAFHGLKQLYKLGLAGNQITSLNQNAFVGLSNLKVLDLSKNPIKTIQENAFAPMTLSQLTADTNSLLCDCAITWFYLWLSSSGVQLSSAFCAYPPKLQGQLLTSIRVEDFLCSEDGSLKPIIVENPSSVIAVSGSKINLSCKAWSSANSSLIFKWKRNNDDIYSQKTMIVNSTSFLEFSPVQSSDSGKYQCIVSNSFGTVYSEKAQLTVLVLPVMVKKPGNVTVRAGSTVKLECAANGEPIPQVGWQKDGGTEFPAAQERRMHVMPTDDVFYIINAKPTDSGLYSCIAKNSAGTVTANATLTVHEAPSFIKKMEDKEVSLGKSTVLECLGSGWPKPKLKWWKDGSSLVLSHRHILTADDQLLFIMDVKSVDAGLYQCEITNSLGTEKTAAQLIIAPAYSAAADDITGVIIITVVCCAVGTSAIWVIIIYQTRKRFRCTAVPKDLSSRAIHLDTKSEHSASSKDSGTGDSTKRSCDEFENGQSPQQLCKNPECKDVAMPLLQVEVGSANHSANVLHTCCCVSSVRENTRSNHDRCTIMRPCSMPASKYSPTNNSIPHRNSFVCLYVSPKPTPV